MHNKRENSYMVDVLFILVLFFTFAFSSLLLVIIGANIYEHTVSDMSVNFNSRTAFAYVTEKIRQGDQTGAVEVGTLDGQDALQIREEINGDSYTTSIYFHEGNLMELFSRSDADLSASAGQKIMKCNDFQVESVSDHLYRIRLTTEDSKEMSLFVSTHSAPVETAPAN
ncbi:MAG: DUF4860 domain-containing protein [Lachnospiraceae bacterium]|nr:DUF4860 domain-containing protein [Lachnospiraceae bacterium]